AARTAPRDPSCLQPPAHPQRSSEPPKTSGKASGGGASPHPLPTPATGSERAGGCWGGAPWQGSPQPHVPTPVCHPWVLREPVERVNSPVGRWGRGRAGQAGAAPGVEEAGDGRVVGCSRVDPGIRVLGTPPKISPRAAPHSQGSEPAMRRLEEDSEVYKMLQENRELRAAPRQSSTFRLLQEALEDEEGGGPAAPFPSRLSAAARKPVAGVQKLHVCEKCGSSIA
uniref:PDZ and LIM domain protein 2-like n=1 Tax=Cyanistes caeruleus TaxID=156563 RepID=A0A8C0U6B0_CYACU